jgi:hypothetical protein
MDASPAERTSAAIETRPEDLKNLFIRQSLRYLHRSAQINSGKSDMPVDEANGSDYPSIEVDMHKRACPPGKVPDE